MGQREGCSEREGEGRGMREIGIRKGDGTRERKGGRQ